MLLFGFNFFWPFNYLLPPKKLWKQTPETKQKPKYFNNLFINLLWGCCHLIFCHNQEKKSPNLNKAKLIGFSCSLWDRCCCCFCGSRLDWSELLIGRQFLCVSLAIKLNHCLFGIHEIWHKTEFNKSEKLANTSCQYFGWAGTSGEVRWLAIKHTLTQYWNSNTHEKQYLLNPLIY